RLSPLSPEQVRRKLREGRRGPDEAHDVPFRLRPLRAAGERNPHFRPGRDALPHGGTGEPLPPAPVRAFRLRGEPGFLHAERIRHRRVPFRRARRGGNIPGSRVPGAPTGEPGVLFPHPRSLIPDLAELSPPRRPPPKLEVLLVPAG